MAQQRRIEGTKVISYESHVADIDHRARLVIVRPCEGYTDTWGQYRTSWSATTSRHINDTARELGYKVQKAKQQPKTEDQPKDDGTGLFRIMSMFGMMAGMNNDPEQAQREREGIVFRTPLIDKPSDWDSLPFEERKRRINAVYDEALKALK